MPKELKLNIECVLEAHNALGESPVWCAREQVLYWVDIHNSRVHQWSPTSGKRQSWLMPSQVGSIGLSENGGVVAALKSGFHLLDIESGEVTFLSDPESNISTNRFNDGKVSPEGRFWAGTMDERSEKDFVGSLYCLDTDLTVRKMTNGVKVSNGLAWSPDGQVMYHSDSRAASIYAYQYNKDTGDIGERNLFSSLKPEWGRPDGAAVDMEGCYWSAGVGAGRINRFNSHGELVNFIQLPVTHPTMPCFGGEDLRTLYITTLRDEVPADTLPFTPLAGHIFKIDLDVPGVPVGLFKGKTK